MRSLTKLILLAASLAAVPGAASANHVPTYCVNAISCPTGATISASPNLALLAAGDEPGPAEVFIGPKPDGTAYAGPFTYDAPTAGDNRVRIIGQGNPALTTAETDTAALLLEGAGNEVLNLDIIVPSVQSADGLALDNGAEATNVDVIRTDLGGGLHNGVTLGHGARLASSTIDMVEGFAVELHGGKTEMDNVTVDAPRGIIGGASDLVLKGSKLRTEFLGLQLIGGSPGGSGISTIVARTEITTSDPAGQGVFLRDMSARFVRTSIASRSAAPEAGRSAIRYEALERSGQLIMQTSLLAGYDKTISRAAPGGLFADLTAFDSEWRIAREATAGIGGLNASHLHFSDTPPRFVDRLAGDLRLRGGDPAIDRNSQLTADELNLTDVGSLPIADGDGDGKPVSDAGAREYRRIAPSLFEVAPAKSGPAGKPLPFSAKASDFDGEKVTIRWTFGDGATATGGTVSHAYALPGIYEGSVTATDEAGLKTTQTFPVVVTGTITPPPPPDTGGGDTGGGDTGSGDTGGDSSGTTGGTTSGTGNTSGTRNTSDTGTASGTDSTGGTGTTSGTGTSTDTTAGTGAGDAGTGSTGPVQPTGGDRTAPRLSATRLTARRTSLRRGRRARLAFGLDEAARLEIAVLARRGARQLGPRLSVSVPAGTGAKRLRVGNRRLWTLARRRAVLSIVAIDAAGNRSQPVIVRLRVRR